ncbi:MAG: TonB-dependent receptor [Betaproteobacteria bacterium]|nr:TonB-dependent receptor [Betaproteobacteria bacterium]
MKQARTYLAFVATLLVVALASAQEGRQVRGVVSDALGRPIAGAQVSLMAADGNAVGQTRTTDDGRFFFAGVPAGTYAIVSEKASFRQGTAIVTVGNADPAPVALAMASEQALDVRVAAERLDRARNQLSPRTGSSQFTFQRADIESLPLGENTSFNDLLTRAPGVANDNFGQLHIRGDHANIQYRINGVILPEGITGFGSALDTRFGDRIDLLTGALPAQYGYRTAGVVEIETKSAYEPGGRAGVLFGSHNTFNPGLELSGAAGPVNYYLTGSYVRNTLGLENPTPNVEAIHDLTRQDKGFAYFSMLPSATTRLTAMFGTYEGRFQIPNIPGNQPDQTTGFTTLNGSTMFDSANLDEKQREVNRYGILALQSTLGENIDYQVAVFQRYTSLHFTPDPNGDLVFLGNASELFKSDRATGIQADASARLNERHTLRSGIFFSNESVVSNNNATVFDASNNIVNIQDNNSRGGNHLFGIYVQDEWKLTSKLNLNYGLRYDQMNAFVKADQLSPRLGATWQWTPQTTLHAAYSRYFTPPPTELVTPKTIALFANTSAAAPAGVPNDPVLPERTHYFDVGLTHRLTSALNVGVDYYYKRVTDLLDEGQFGPAPIFTPFNYKEGRVQGLELTANYKKDNLSAYANLAWSTALGKEIVSSQASAGFQQSDLNFIATNWVHLDHDQTYTASGGVSYQGGKTRYSVDAVFGSGLRITPDGSLNKNSGHLPSYTVVNVAAVHRFDDTPLGRLDGRLAVVNVFDKIYELRDGTGIGVGPPAFGQRRAVYAGVTKVF